MLKPFLSNKIKPFVKGVLESIYKRSLDKAAKEQGLKDLINKLEQSVPDITNQYSTVELKNQYLRKKVRNMHAFQISLGNEVIEKFENPVIVDIGDSAGTHLQYLMALHNQVKNVNCYSVNLDADAVAKIKEKGLNAINSRAENLDQYNIEADIFLCFQMLEHLMNPCYFLHELSEKTNVKYLVITVPYLKKSRTGFHHIRRNKGEIVQAENTHIFELSPEDWKRLIMHSGWDIINEKKSLQYPKRSIYRFTKPLWRKYDFEGFYGMILKRNNTWSSRYLDW